jgi:hypothetical protein
MTKFVRQQAFEVFRTTTDGLFRETRTRHIDTVFFHEHPKMTVEDVRRSLIDHDGYPADIIVRKAQRTHTRV